MRENKLWPILVKRCPLSVADFMAEALTGEHGYYRKDRDPLGEDGDFITAPEISQIFGELIGLWCADRWQKMNCPQDFILCELGPGRGTLMQDAMRAGAKMPGFKPQIFLLEASPLLRRKQAEKLAAHAPRWIEQISELPPCPVIFIANEFFDALPVEQILFEDGAWRQRMVVYDEAHHKFRFTSGDKVIPPAPFPKTAPKQGDIFEYSPVGKEFMRAISHHIKTHGGAALVVDYGHLQSGFGDTLQAVRHHRFADPLENPGEVDLTCHVDFEALAHGVKTEWMGAQGEFLRGLGFDLRLRQLQEANKAQSAALESARRLTDAGQMGTLFKVAVFS